MQFGKLHGYAIIALGLIFFVFFLATTLPNLQPSTPAPSTAQSTPTPHKNSYIPLIPAAICFLLGGYFVIADRRHPSANESQPKTTKSGLPM
ncbi:MAG TPA: hypothetical protein VGI16_08805 [Candidatus Acidoferrum sp.]|jgi:hypothetical protein